MQFKSISYLTLFFLTFPILSILNAQTENKSVETAMTKIYIVRHAERNPGADPPLNARGFVRADLVKDLLADSGITAIYCPNLLRNRQTAAPLAKHLRIKPKLIPKSILSDTKETAQYVKTRIFREDSGGHILYIGNQSASGHQMGNIQELQKALGVGEIPLTRYPDMYILTLQDTTLIQIHHVIYGEEI